MEILKLLFFSFSAVVYLFIMSRILGKKSMAQLDLIDFTISISIGSIASEMATDLTETPYHFYLISMAVFTAFHYVISILERKGGFLKKLFTGRPLIVIHDGKLHYGNLKKSRLDLDDLIAQCRDKGYFDLSDIAFAVLENNGTLSVMPKDGKREVAAEDLLLPLKKASMPLYAVSDGQISHPTLKEIGKDTGWLFDRLNIQTKKDLKKILMAVYDAETDDFSVHYKTKA